MRLDPLPKKQKETSAAQAVFSAGMKIGQGTPAEMSVLFENEIRAHRGTVEIRENLPDGKWKVVRRRQQV